MARRSFANLDRHKVTWLVIALALIAISIALRLPTLTITVLNSSSSPVLWYIVGLHSCICFIWFRWCPLNSRIAMILIAVLWPVFDQVVVLFQRYLNALPLLELPELAAGELGVWIGWFGCWFIKPYAGIAEKRRREFSKFAFLHALHQKRNRINILSRFVLSVIGCVGLATLFPLAIYLIVYQGQDNNQTGFVSLSNYIFLILASIGGLLGIVQGIIIVWRWAVIKRTKEHQDTMPCFKCRESCCEILFDTNGWSTCAKCATQIHKGQWIAPPRLMAMSVKQRSRMQFAILRALAAGVLFAVLVFFLAFALEYFAIDFFVGMHLALIIYFILVFRCIRIEVARRNDRQHIECRECGYELQGISIEQGVGICPECGLRFAKFVK